MGFFDNINDKVARSAVGRWFRLDGSGHPLQRPGSKFTTELRAGTVTAASMIYIIAVNASILSDSGGPCVCESTPDDPICAVNTAYNLYLADGSTSAISLISTFLMGSLANLPLGLAPGLGVNAFFAYSQVGFNGTGIISYGEALAAVFLEGLLFFVLTIFGLRQWMVRLLPRSIVLAISAGIGLFLTIIGLSSSGLGVIAGAASTPLELAGCPAEYQSDLGTGACASHVLQNPTVWLGALLGGLVTAILMQYRVKGALLYGIVLVSIVSWPRPTAVTQFPHTPLGDDNFAFFKQVVSARGFSLLGPKNVDWSAYSNGKVWVALISFLYVDLLDTTGTMTAMARQASLYSETERDFEGSSVGFLVDSICIAFSGVFFGCSPCTPFVESASGIAEGGATGLTAITTAFWFFISIFFAPLLSNIPAWATGSVLIIVGSMMMSSAVDINWDFYGDSIPAFVCLALIPFTYNISYGIIAGLCIFIVMHNIPLLLGQLSPRLLPPGWDTLKEPYNISAMVQSQAQHGTTGFKLLLPPWMRKLTSGNRRFWEYTPEEIESHLEGKRHALAKADAAKEYRQRERDEMRGKVDLSVGVHDVERSSGSEHRSHDDKNEAIMFAPQPERGSTPHDDKSDAVMFAPQPLRK
ncbi:hypothetical protein IAR55_002604 [Kwoniella newhampshirensis]|uniref:Xanthine/uracil permease n=1 Tax=Kwoniella newhampshirensis TaxID=1651941 RepID=A0AAW0YZR7_9TREE